MAIHGKLLMFNNDGFEYTLDSCGLLPMENSTDFTPGQRSAVTWSGNKIRSVFPGLCFISMTRVQLQVVVEPSLAVAGHIRSLPREQTGLLFLYIAEFSSVISATIYLGRLAYCPVNCTGGKIISDCQIRSGSRCLLIDVM